MKMRNAYPLLIAILLATPLMRAMEMEENAMEIEQLDATKLLLAELQVQIISCLKNELPPPEIVTKWYSGSPVNALSYDPDGEHIATGHCNGKVRIYSVKNGELKKTWNTGSPVWALAHSYNGEYVATGHYNGQVQTFLAKKGNFRTTWNTGLTLGVDGLHPTPDRAYIATGHSGGCVRIRASDNRLNENWKAPVAILALNHSSNGKYIAMGDFEGLVQIYSTKNSNLIGGWKSKSMETVTALHFILDEYIVAGYFNGDVQISLLEDGELKKKWNTGLAVCALHSTRDGEYIATGHNDEHGSVKIWHILPALAAHKKLKKSKDGNA